MPWSSYNRLFDFNRTSIESNAPLKSGIYGCCNNDEWVFIGNSNNLREALLEVERAGFGSHSVTAFTYELWPSEVRRGKAWNLIVEYEPACNTEYKHSIDELFHFVGFAHPNDRSENYKILRKILSERQLKRRWRGDSRLVSLEFNPTESLRRGELMDSNVICFCDIRSGELGIHMRKYGEFGLGFYRGVLIRQNARPVTYIPCYLDDWRSIGGTTLIKDILAVYESFNELVIKQLPERDLSRGLGSRIHDKDEASEAIASVYQKDFMAFIKAYDSTLPEDDLQHFFMEREWRKFGSFGFQPGQVTTIVVAPDYVEQAKTDLPEYTDRIKDITKYM